MIDENAFLRNLPRGLDLEDRLRFEAIITAADVIDLSFSRLVHCLTAIADRQELAISNKDKTELALGCWSIVDQFYAITRLLTPYDEARAGWLNLAELNSTVSNMRNRMDHLHQNLPNLAGRRGHSHPLHGGVLYGRKSTSGPEVEYVMFNLGGLHHPSQVSPVMNLPFLSAPAGTAILSFAAFDVDLDMSRLHRELRSFLQRFNEAVEIEVAEVIRTEAPIHGVDPDVALNERVGSPIAIRMKVRGIR